MKQYTKEFSISFTCGDGFSGRSYYMNVNGVSHHLCTNLGNDEPPKIIATTILKDKYEIQLDENTIEFIHDGSM